MQTNASYIKQQKHCKQQQYGVECKKDKGNKPVRSSDKRKQWELV